MPPKSVFPCPVCGEDVPAKAKACPYCGACEKSGWNEEAGDYDGLDLPGDDFDYEKFTEEEFGQPRKLQGRKLFWRWTTIIVAAVLLVLFAATLFFRF